MHLLALSGSIILWPGIGQIIANANIGGDFLLIYRLGGAGDTEQIIFVRAGTHADLFE
jgi:mRNA-degrading endonuclease YafQ of YafQ-DinJ toxin-antitoxin module